MQTTQQTKSQAKEIQKKAANLPASINLEESAGQGQENVTARDLKLQ